MSRDPVQDLFPSHLGVSQDPGLVLRNKSGNLCQGLGPLPSLQQTLHQWSSPVHESYRAGKSGLELRLLPEHGEFINRVNKTDIRKGPGTLS